jgi:hypothetical protein
MQIKIKPKDTIRNLQYDDFFYKNGELVFEIAETGNEIYDKLILIHAIIEEMLTKHAGIPEEVISNFDKNHLNVEEPGLEIDAPYRDAHLFAEGIERLICSYLKIPWKKYEEIFCA